mgnify:CR=1 FL=1
MNGELKRRAIAIIDGEKATVAEKLDLLLGIALDTHGQVTGHEARISTLEAIPSFARQAAKLLLVVGALAAAYAAVSALVPN